MTNLIPAEAGHVAVFTRTRSNGTDYAVRKPVIAWDANGNAYVHDDDFGGLAEAGTQRGYKKTEITDEPVVAAAPATGWTAEFIASETTTTFRPVVAWAVRRNGDTFPIAVDTGGEGFNPLGDPDFIRLVGPGDAA
ncbi:hypothetical protein ACIRVK_13730 [Streptomyces sp. NPDC101152]|uniref:hypothetical protein n=1 Tax=Streptomyces sp. NPDC101152 TaxID=3366116 RepID=UPI003826633A